MLVIIHSGQTGVERGAHRAALALGVGIAGFMPLDKRDELGPVPPDVADQLTPCFDRGPRPAVRANVALASGAIVVVPDAQTADKFTAIGAVIQAVRAAGIPYLACDPLTNLEDITRWVHQLPETSGSTRVLVTGPRGTRWPQGETLARRIVGAMTIS